MKSSTTSWWPATCLPRSRTQSLQKTKPYMRWRLNVISRSFGWTQKSRIANIFRSMLLWGITQLRSRVSWTPLNHCLRPWGSTILCRKNFVFCFFAVKFNKKLTWHSLESAIAQTCCSLSSYLHVLPIQFNSTKRCHSSHLYLASQLPPCTKRACTRVPSRVAQTNHRVMDAPNGQGNQGLLSHHLYYWSNGLSRWWRDTTEHRTTSALTPEARVLYWPLPIQRLQNN